MQGTAIKIFINYLLLRNLDECVRSDNADGDKLTAENLNKILLFQRHLVKLELDAVTVREVHQGAVIKVTNDHVSVAGAGGRVGLDGVIEHNGS